MNNIIVIPTSEDIDAPWARRALQLCVDRKETELTLFEVVYEPHLEGYMGNSELYQNLRQRLVDERSEQLEKLAAEFRKQGCRCSVVAVWGKPFHSVLANQVLRSGSELVVMAPADAETGISRSEWQLVSHCPAPALIVIGDAGAPYKRVLAAVDPYHAHGKPPELDLKILQLAQSIRDASSAEMSVVHCFTPLSEISVHGYMELPIDAAEQALEEARRHALENLLGEAGLDVGLGKLVSGRPGQVLSSMADGEQADLLIMGSVSRSAFREFFIGSTTEKVLDEARCDVLVVKPEGFEVTVSV